MSESVVMPVPIEQTSDQQPDAERDAQVPEQESPAEVDRRIQIGPLDA